MCSDSEGSVLFSTLKLPLSSPLVTALEGDNHSSVVGLVSISSLSILCSSSVMTLDIPREILKSLYACFLIAVAFLTPHKDFLLVPLNVFVLFKHFLVGVPDI